MSNLAAAQAYGECATANADSVEQLVICLANHMTQSDELKMYHVERNRIFFRNIFITTCAAMVFFMQAGFAMVCAGAVRRKNLQNTMLKNLLDATGASIAFYSVGYAFAFGDGTNPNGFIGTTNYFLTNVDDIPFWLFQYTFSAASATIVAGTLAERCQMQAYFYYSMFLSGFVYPVVVHAIWSPHGFLSGYKEDDPLFGVGVLDTAGSGVVHLTGGFASLLATWVLGPRRGRFHHEVTGQELDEPGKIQGSNISIQLLGTMILWFGWYGFNTGSAFLNSTTVGDVLAMQAGATTTLAAGAGGLSALFLNYSITQRRTGRGKFDLVATMNGVLSGLVAVTAGCSLVDTWASILIGAVSGVLYLLGSSFLIRNKLDDAVDAMPVHMVNGIWGMLSVGLFATPDWLEISYGRSDYAGLFYGGGLKLLAAQIVGVLSIVFWVLVTMLPFFLLLQTIGIFRTAALDEIHGLDKSFHGSEQKGDLEDTDMAKLTQHVEAQFLTRQLEAQSVSQRVPSVIGAS